jgi:hypothetical protein
MSNYFPCQTLAYYSFGRVGKTLLNLSAFMQGLRPFWLLYIE